MLKTTPNKSLQTTAQGRITTSKIRLERVYFMIGVTLIQNDTKNRLTNRCSHLSSLGTIEKSASASCALESPATAGPKIWEHPSPLNHMTIARSAFKQQHQRSDALGSSRSRWRSSLRDPDVV